MDTRTLWQGVTSEDVHWSEEDIERNKPQSSLGYYVYDITNVPEETTADCNGHHHRGLGRCGRIREW